MKKKDMYLEPWKSDETWDGLKTKWEKKEAMRRIDVYKVSFDVEFFYRYLTPEGPEERGPKTIASHGYETRILEGACFVYCDEKLEGGYWPTCGKNCKNYYKTRYLIDIDHVCERMARKDYKEILPILDSHYDFQAETALNNGEELLGLTVELARRHGHDRSIMLEATFDWTNGFQGDLDPWESDPDPED